MAERVHWCRPDEMSKPPPHPNSTKPRVRQSRGQPAKGPTDAPDTHLDKSPKTQTAPKRVVVGAESEARPSPRKDGPRQAREATDKTNRCANRRAGGEAQRPHRHHEGDEAMSPWHIVSTRPVCPLKRLQLARESAREEATFQWRSQLDVPEVTESRPHPCGPHYSPSSWPFKVGLGPMESPSSSARQPAARAPPRRRIGCPTFLGRRPVIRRRTPVVARVCPRYHMAGYRLSPC